MTAHECRYSKATGRSLDADARKPAPRVCCDLPGDAKKKNRSAARVPPFVRGSLSELCFFLAQFFLFLLFGVPVTVSALGVSTRNGTGVGVSFCLFFCFFLSEIRLGNNKERRFDRCSEKSDVKNLDAVHGVCTVGIFVPIRGLPPSKLSVVALITFPALFFGTTKGST